MFCIPKINATKLINSLRGDGLSKISQMTSEQRREFFAKNVGEDMAKKVNAEFEKALATQRKSALVKFAEKIVGKKKERFDVIQRIKNLDEKGLLDGNILEDHVSDVLGAKITTKEVETVKKIGEKLRVTKEASEKELEKAISKQEITKEYQDSLIAYAKALKEADEFLIGKSATDWSSTIWNNMKASMLFNPASWGINIFSNIELAGITAIERRLKTMRLSGHSSDLARAWKKTMLKVRKETGYDMSRALSLDEMLEKKIIGERLSIGKDNFFTKLVYDDALGRPDAWGGRMAFADALDLESSSLVKGLGLKEEAAKIKAREIFMDAIQLSPKTEEGKLARQIAVQEAQVATWTNKGALATATLKLKEGLNKFAENSLGLKGFKLGDMIEPFVKTPANIAQYGLDASGLGIIRGAGKFVSLVKNHSMLDKVQRKTLLGEAMRDSLRTGFGVGGALALASFIKADDFVGSYDPNRWKYEQLRNSNTNSIRIGNKWYSLDYFGPIATPLVAVLYAKKYGKGNIAKMLGQYAVGIADQASNIPFVGSLKDMAMTYNQKVDPNNPDAVKQGLDVIYNIFSDQITSRVPGLLTNIAKLFDINDREAEGFLKTLQSKVPILRKGLPVKQDFLGQDIMTEVGVNEGTQKYVAMLTQILAGARIKTAKDRPYANEIYRLKESGNGASFTSWNYRLGKRQQALKDKVGNDEYRRIYREEYGKVIIDKISKKISEERYKKMSDADKKLEINKINDAVIDRIYSKYRIPLRIK